MLADGQHTVNTRGPTAPRYPCGRLGAPSGPGRPTVPKRALTWRARNISSLPDGVHTNSTRPPVAVVKACWLPWGTRTRLPGPPEKVASPTRNSYYPSRMYKSLAKPWCACGGFSAITA